MMICVVVLPSYYLLVVCLFYVNSFHVGEIHRRGVKNQHSRSPLSEPEKFTGDYTGEEDVMCGGSPLFSCLLCFRLNTCFRVGEIHRRGVKNEFSFSPLWTEILNTKWRVPILCIYAFWRFRVFPHIDIHRMAGCNWPPHYMYIYSLGHFLSTKGALIDGDWHPPLPPLKWVKKGAKNSEIWSKLSSKKWQKTCFLMAKSSFSSKLIKLQQKWVKNDQKSTHI